MHTKKSWLAERENKLSVYQQGFLFAFKTNQKTPYFKALVLRKQNLQLVFVTKDIDLAAIRLR